ncbi:hypothetical protein AA313_de0201840 [Arthrobotrys entomopaga]|nr:hypothetical protein AA313_de0201840 [Arthrobotrys entomopaga]
MVPKCSRSWEVFAALTSLFVGANAQLTANDGLCQRFGHQGTLVGDKLILAGGYKIVKDTSTGVVSEQATNDFQSLDLGPQGTSFGLDKNSVHQNGPPWKAINYTVTGAAGLPEVANGGMFRNGEDLYIYEGRLPALGPEASSSLWKYTSATSTWGQEFTWTHSDAKLPNRVSRGGSTTVGDQGIGVYVGGARIFKNDSANSGDWYYPSEEQLTIFDLKTLNRTTTNLPSSQKRAGAALAYLPIGTEGAVIMIGGTLENDEIRETGNIANIAQENFDPDDLSFAPMQSVSILDVATKKIYSQSTFGSYFPDSRMEACIAVGAAPDGSSYNIYMFGGSTGSSFLDRTAESYFNDLYILSIPSFRWIQHTFEASNRPPTGRVQHTCHAYGKNLVVLGGATLNNTQDCTWDEVNILDMTTLTWLTSYSYSADGYSVPDVIMGSISNNGKVQTDPVNGWDDHNLQALFQNSGQKSNTMVKIVAIAGGVAGGVILLLVLFAGGYHYRKRQREKRAQKLLKTKVAYESSRYNTGYDPSRDRGAMELHSSPTSATSNTFDSSSGYAHPGKLWRGSHYSYELSEADVDYRDDDEAKLIIPENSRGMPSDYFELGNPSTPTAMERHELGGGKLIKDSDKLIEHQLTGPSL